MNLWEQKGRCNVLCTLIFSEHGHFLLLRPIQWVDFWGPIPMDPSKRGPRRSKPSKEACPNEGNDGNDAKKRDLKSRYGKTAVRSLTDWVALVYVRIHKRASWRLLKGLFFEQSDVLFVCEVMCIFSELRNSKSMNLYVFVLKPLISFSC